MPPLLTFFLTTKNTLLYSQGGMNSRTSFVCFRTSRTLLTPINFPLTSSGQKVSLSWKWSPGQYLVHEKTILQGQVPGSTGWRTLHAAEALHAAQEESIRQNYIIHKLYLPDLQATNFSYSYIIVACYLCQHSWSKLGYCCSVFICQLAYMSVSRVKLKI